MYRSNVQHHVMFTLIILKKKKKIECECDNINHYLSIEGIKIQ